jgi:hypothetical protein
MTHKYRFGASILVWFLFLVFVAGHAGICAAKPPEPVHAAEASTKPFDPARFTLYERMAHSVVVLPGCAGFVVRSSRSSQFVLTARHCVSAFRQTMGNGTAVMLPVPVETNLGWGKLCFGTVLATSEKDDLALIGIEGCRLPAVAASLAKDEPRLGQAVYSVGHPVGAQYVLTSGIVSRSRFRGHMVVSASVESGNSGGPVFDSAGRIVGLSSVALMAPVFRMDGSPGRMEKLELYVNVPHLQLCVALDRIRVFLAANGK